MPYFLTSRIMFLLVLSVIMLDVGHDYSGGEFGLYAKS
jgi:hypothetical protein